MAELLEAVVSWPSLLLVLVVFGFAPGFCLRLIVLAYPRGDPRRDELIAELHAVPRVQRPLWVDAHGRARGLAGLTQGAHSRGSRVSSGAGVPQPQGRRPGRARTRPDP